LRRTLIYYHAKRISKLHQVPTSSLFYSPMEGSAKGQAEKVLSHFKLDDPDDSGKVVRIIKMFPPYDQALLQKPLPSICPDSSLGRANIRR